MESIFNPLTREKIITRISALNADSKASWGRMNVYQMLRHCIRCEEMYQGKRTYKRVLIGRLFGQAALKAMLKDETHMKRNSPTGAAFIIKETQGDVETEKLQWTTLMREYEQYSPDGITHWFFGKMTKEQVGRFVFKHADHHLRHFGV